MIFNKIFWAVMVIIFAPSAALFGVAINIFMSGKPCSVLFAIAVTVLNAIVVYGLINTSRLLYDTIVK